MFVINKELQSTDEKGLTFTLDADQPCLDFFLLDAIVNKTLLPQKSRKDAFISERRLKPEGLILTVHPRQLKIWNFDGDFTRMPDSCKLENSFEFSPSIS